MKKRLILVNVILASMILAYFIIHAINPVVEEDSISSEWIKYSRKPILGDSSTGSLFDPNVIIDNDGTYRMYVSWRTKGVIAISTSNDGINWGELEIALGNDLSTGWEDIVNRATVIYKDNMYYMWYTGQYNDISKIGYATSTDGYTFEKMDEPVLVPEQQWEQKSVMNPYVIYDENEKLFKMWYAAGETYEPDVIAYATSEDGINWNKFDENPIFKANEDKSTLDSYKVGGCEVHKFSNDEYIMFYIGYVDLDTAGVFVATSKNGVTDWTRYGNSPIIKSTKGTFDEEACYKPSAIWNEKNNMWMVWYNGRTGNKEYIGLSTCNKYDFLSENS
jgi:sucrose-6-phosphate hydrolase SacC (GH32 family)